MLDSTATAAIALQHQGAALVAAAAAARMAGLRCAAGCWLPLLLRPLGSTCDSVTTALVLLQSRFAQTKPSWAIYLLHAANTGRHAQT
jgi:hypothetical protein